MKKYSDTKVFFGRTLFRMRQPFFGTLSEFETDQYRRKLKTDRKNIQKREVS